jgi:hypothetical protein
MHFCDVPNCNRLGLHSDKTNGAGPWYCRQHQAQRDARRARPSPKRVAAEIAFFAPNEPNTEDQQNDR